MVAILLCRLKDRALLERVQHRFTRMVPGIKDLPYEDRLAQLGLWSLEERRHRADLLEVFRMYKGLSLTPFSQIFTLSPVNNTRGHSAKIQKNHCSVYWTSIRRHFFSQRVVNSKSLKLFTSTRHRLGKHQYSRLLYGLSVMALRPHMF